MQSICHVSPSTTWCMTSLIIVVRSLLGGGAQKQEVGQGKDEDEVVRWMCTVPSTEVNLHARCTLLT